LLGGIIENQIRTSSCHKPKLALWPDEVRILIFDDPAEQETSQRPQFSSAQLNSTTAVNLVLNLVLQSSRGACIDFSPELGMQAAQRLTRIKLTRISGDFLRHLVPGLIAKSYMPWMKMQYLTGGQRLYANSATAVDQICRFQGKIRIKVDKIA